MSKSSSRSLALQVKIWGARGSLPSPHSPVALQERIRDILVDFFTHGLHDVSQIDGYLKGLPRHRFGGFGGNTPCIEVRSASTQIVIDGGSGIRQLGYELMAGPCGRGQGEVHILFTHFHWDHLIGLPFFTPLFIPGNKIHVYAVQEDLPSVFASVFKKPYFPIQLEQLGAKIEYHRLEPRKSVRIGDIDFTPYQLDHPDPCWGYRFEKDGKVFSHCVDTEATRVSREQLGEDLPLYQGVDLMTFDAQYTLLETIEKVNWGHAAASIGLDIAMREGTKKIIFMHHDPASTDEKIAAAEAQAQRYFKSQVRSLRAMGAKHKPAIEWMFAYEGMTLEI